MRVSLIGHGRLGKLISGFLSRDVDLEIFDQSIDRPLSDISQSSVVLLCVPISQMEKVCQEIAPHLKENTLVIDVCSVKEYPMNVMKKNLPGHVQILGTHPMFGPDSIHDTLFGAKLVLCNESCNEELYTKIKLYLSNQGMRLIESTPEEHDRSISKTLILSHFIGNTLMEFGAQEELIDTKGYRRLLRILDTVKNDTNQLFNDMNKYNRFSKNMREEFISVMKNISDKADQYSK